MHIPDECVTASTGQRVTVSEKGKTFVVWNPNGKSVRKVTVDGCVITDAKTPRCDYLFEVGTPLERALYVELKGKNLKRACDQLSSTLGLFKNRHGSLPRQCFVVASRVPSLRTDTQVLMSKFYRENKVRVYFKSQQHEETI